MELYVKTVKKKENSLRLKRVKNASFNKCEQDQDTYTMVISVCNFIQQTAKVLIDRQRVQLDFVDVVFRFLQFSARLVAVQQVKSLSTALV